MNSALEIDGKVLYPIKDAAQSTTYSRDYITRLAREGKIVASYIGRQWFVDCLSLKAYAENAALEQEVRKKMLSQERKRERQLREVTESQHTLHIKKSETLHFRAVAAAAFVLMFGLMVGQGAYFLSNGSTALFPQTVSLEQTAQVGATDAAKPVAQPAGDIAPASFTQKSLGDVAEGVVLFPSTGDTANPALLFSDSVEVRQQADGSRVVVPVDAAGNQIGNEVPFVTVPVSNSNI